VERRLHFLESFASQVALALTNVVLLRRLRSQAGAAERARVARELHDGTIQALFGIEMKLQALRNEVDDRDPGLAASLADVQELLRAEILGVRELMQTLRPVELDGIHQLPDVLAGVVERFRRDSGISARFVSNIDSIHLTPSASIEVVRIVQEALANVRKHSRARNVLVRLTGKDDAYTLTVEDDGRGFDFEGAFSQEQLDRARLGPAIIKERTRLLGGQLTVESTRGAGARIQVTFGAPVHA
jgi:signal transduction histidine kinase